jgi:hypothetical protein
VTARTTTRIFIVIAAALVLIVAVSLGFLSYVFVVASGRGGWAPNAGSSQAVRARVIDAQLHPGMTRGEVLTLFKTDTDMNATDGMNKSLADSSERVWSDEADLYVNERHRFFWNSYDTVWTVRAGFNNNGYLIHHRVDVERTNGP